MRTLALVMAAGLCLTWGLAEAQAGDKAAACGDHGTAVKFVDTPKEAAEQAKKEQKLVFVLHISGHFEDPGLT